MNLLLFIFYYLFDAICTEKNAVIGMRTSDGVCYADGCILNCCYKSDSLVRGIQIICLRFYWRNRRLSRIGFIRDQCVGKKLYFGLKHHFKTRNRVNHTLDRIIQR